MVLKNAKNRKFMSETVTKSYFIGVNELSSNKGFVRVIVKKCEVSVE